MKVKTRVACLIALILVAVLGFFLIQRFYSKQALERLYGISDDPRLKLWESALHVFRQNPFIGGGMSAATTISRVEAGNDSHNVYIDILCNSGIVGSLLFLIFLFRGCLRSNKTNRVFIYSMFIAFMLPMFFINGFNTATFYTPLILLSIMSQYCRKRDANYLDFLIAA